MENLPFGSIKVEGAMESFASIIASISIKPKVPLALPAAHQQHDQHSL